jgi:hypothetical protein
VKCPCSLPSLQDLGNTQVKRLQGDCWENCDKTAVPIKASSSCQITKYIYYLYLRIKNAWMLFGQQWSNLTSFNTQRHSPMPAALSPTERFAHIIKSYKKFRCCQHGEQPTCHSERYNCALCELERT